MPRQKKTEPKQDSGDIDVLADLSVQEQRLVEALAEGLNNVDAYRRAYGAEGYSAPALRVRACRKIAEPKIQAALRVLRSVGLANAKLTLDDRIEHELAFAQRAEDAGNFGAAGGAYDRINKLLGLYVDKYEDVTQHDPLKTLDEIAKVSPDYAMHLAKKHGIAWTAPGAEDGMSGSDQTVH